MKTALLALAALISFSISALHADEATETEASSDKPKLITITDPEIAAATDEEPDCE